MHDFLNWVEVSYGIPGLFFAMAGIVVTLATTLMVSMKITRGFAVFVFPIFLGWLLAHYMMYLGGNW